MSQRQLIAAPQVFSGPADSKVLVRKAVQPPKVSAKKKTGHSKLSITLVSLAAIMFCSGLYIAYLGLRADHASQVQAAKLTQVANQASKTTQPAAASAALSTVKPASDAIANYVVAPNLPRYLIIPSLGVDARVLSVGVNSQGALETPNNIYDAAWYNESGQPGQPGAMLIDGHISSWTAHGVFYGLKDLKPGDAIQIVRGDGAIFNYQVVESQTYNVANVDMTAAMTPIVPGTPGLNLISCSGDVIAGTSEFNERIIVFAKQV
jgi:sortase (surface protein transpeptidase)